MKITTVGSVFLSSLPFIGPVPSYLAQRHLKIDSPHAEVVAYRIADVLCRIITLALLISFITCPILSFLIIPFWVTYLISSIALDLMKVYHENQTMDFVLKSVVSTVFLAVLTQFVTSFIAIGFEGLELGRRIIILIKGVDLNESGVKGYYYMTRAYFTGKSAWNELANKNHLNEPFPNETEVYQSLITLRSQIDRLHLIALLSQPATHELIEAFKKADEKNQNRALQDPAIIHKIQSIQQNIEQNRKVNLPKPLAQAFQIYLTPAHSLHKRVSKSFTTYLEAPAAEQEDAYKTLLAALRRPTAPLESPIFVSPAGSPSSH